MKQSHSCSSFILHPSSFILPAKRRAGQGGAAAGQCL
jgi:hypothetical protein